MTPLTLFEYIVAIILGIGFSLLVLIYVLAQMIDWDKYEASQRRKCKCVDKS